jgi:hypothetical protein
VEDVWETGQKELRIIDTLEPIIGAGKFICDAGLLKRDWEQCKKYPIEKQASYSLWYQLSRITREKGALIHDDRLDAVAGACRPWIEHLRKDELQAKMAAQLAAHNAMMKDPLRTGRSPDGYGGMRGQSRTPNAFGNTRRRF